MLKAVPLLRAQNVQARQTSVICGNGWAEQKPNSSKNKGAAGLYFKINMSLKHKVEGNEEVAEDCSYYYCIIVKLKDR